MGSKTSCPEEDTPINIYCSYCDSTGTYIQIFMLIMIYFSEHSAKSCEIIKYFISMNTSLKIFTRSLHKPLWRMKGTISNITPLFDDNIKFNMKEYKEYPFFCIKSGFNSTQISTLHNTFVVILVYPQCDLQPSQMTTFYVKKISWYDNIK